MSFERKITFMSFPKRLIIESKPGKVIHNMSSFVQTQAISKQPEYDYGW